MSVTQQSAGGTVFLACQDSPLEDTGFNKRRATAGRSGSGHEQPPSIGPLTPQVAETGRWMEAARVRLMGVV